jgi:hypothetical protein
MCCRQTRATRRIDRDRRAAQIQMIANTVGYHGRSCGECPASFGFVLDGRSADEGYDTKSRAYLLRNHKQVMGNCRHERRDIFSTIINPRIPQSQERLTVRP